jgi:hypothetical protein
MIKMRGWGYNQQLTSPRVRIPDGDIICLGARQAKPAHHVQGHDTLSCSNRESSLRPNPPLRNTLGQHQQTGDAIEIQGGQEAARYRITSGRVSRRQCLRSCPALPQSSRCWTSGAFPHEKFALRPRRGEPMRASRQMTAPRGAGSRLKNFGAGVPFGQKNIAGPPSKNLGGVPFSIKGGLTE